MLPSIVLKHNYKLSLAPTPRIRYTPNPMAITKGAKKAHRASQRKRIYNVRRKAVLHDTLKAYTDHLNAGNTTDAQALLSTVYKAIDKATKRGVLKPNTASRKKSRLALRLVQKGK